MGVTKWIRIGDNLINMNNVDYVSISKNEIGEYNAMFVMFIHGNRLPIRAKSNEEFLDIYLRFVNRVS